MTVLAVSFFRNGHRLPASAGSKRADPEDDPDDFAWISLSDPTREDLEDVRDRCGLRLPVCVELLRSSRRPQVEDCGDHWCVGMPTAGAPGRDGVAALVGRGYVVTVDHGASTIGRRLGDRIRAGSGSGVTGRRIVHGILALAIDDHHRAIGALEERVTAFGGDVLTEPGTSTRNAAAARMRVRLVSIADTLEAFVEVGRDLDGQADASPTSAAGAPVADLLVRARAAARWADAVLQTLDAAIACRDCEAAREQGRRRTSFAAGLLLAGATLIVVRMLAGGAAGRPVSLLLALAVFAARSCLTLCAVVLLLGFLKLRSRS